MPCHHRDPHVRDIPGFGEDFTPLRHVPPGDPRRGQTDTVPPKTFADFGVDPALASALADQDIVNPFPIQELTLPMALKGADVIGQARTGTGKTLAFGLPLLQRVDPDRAVTQALVITPTRELCMQVTEDLTIGRERGLTTTPVYGGVPLDPQTDALRKGSHVVVGTPGRLLDHLNRGNLDLSRVTELVLDEADEMLDMGFLPDVERLIEACTGERRHTMLFSATMPNEIVRLARRYMSHPTFLRAASDESDVAPTVEQHFFLVHRMDKPRVLARLLQTPERGSVYVFTRTKSMADRLTSELGDLGVPAIAIHGDLRQATREKNMDRFREGKADVLVATEVAARGLDVENVTHVVNYDCPDDEKMYLHRIGRTARAGNEGVAVTFATFNEVDRLNVIRKAVDADREIEEIFSTSDLLTDRFELPEETPWDHLARTSGGGNGGGKRSNGSSGRSDRGSRSKGSSDGRSKNRGRSQGRGEQGSSRSERRRDRDAEADIVRTRTRTRTRDDSDDSNDRGTDTGSGRTRAGKDAGSKAKNTGTAKDTSTSTDTGKAKDAGEAKDAGTSGDTSSSGGSTKDRGSSSGRTRARKRAPSNPAPSRGGGKGDGGRSSTPQRSGRQEPAAHNGGGRSRKGSRSGSSSVPTSEVPVPAGEEARGSGRPQLARRVKVEHLP